MQLQNVSLSFKDLSVNGKPSKLDQLLRLRDQEEGVAQFLIQTPSVLLASAPAPITDRTVEWLMMTLGDKGCAELWKLSVVTVACNHFYFTWEQALEVGPAGLLDDDVTV